MVANIIDYIDFNKKWIPVSSTKGGLMNKLLLIMAFKAITFVMPGTVQASEYINPVETTNSAVQAITQVTNNEIPVEIKYATTEAGIYLKPSIDENPYDISEINTSFEVVYEINEWSVITTQDGFAYVQSEFLADEPLYTEEDLYYLTGILVGECHGYSWEHQIAVGSVVLNRVADEDYPDTIKDVAHQKGQYACLKNKLFYRKPTERNREVAKYLLENGSQIPENVIYQSKKKQGSGTWKTIDGQYFCYK